ncbi:MAG TPA: SEC-C domain-containing protein [Thermoanaerobaculia bacterium]|jgi:hypothetical protein|nr:SEC-C domain-containing protein [Thermoanaerobaculia bacterium]
MSPGRNDPCPCGSGRKYKKCHLVIEAAEAAAAEPHRAPVHDAGLRLVERIGEWAHDRFGTEFKVADKDLGLDDMTAGLQFLVPWTIFHRPVRGMPAFEWFAREEAANISRRERELIDAQRQSWIGIWEVRESIPGKSMILADLLSGEKRLVQEASASRSLVARDVIMGRVVNFGDVSVIDGMHPNGLPPEDGAYAVEAVSRTLKTTLPISLERLREFAVSLLIATAWKSAVEAYEERRRTPPRLQNTDGDPFLLTVDHYRFAPADRAAIEAAVAALKGASTIEENDDDTHSITFIKSGNRLHKDWENTTIGVVITSENELRIETNSTRRADALRKPVEKACRRLIIDHRRTQTDAVESFASARDAGPPLGAPEPMDADVQAVIRNQKASHYESWLDTSVPALGGKTPRQAARNPRGRDALNALLKTIENGEARQPAATRYDVNILRRALGVED